MTVITDYSRFWLATSITCLLAVTPATAAQGARQTLWERTDGPFYSRSVLWDRSELTEVNLRLLYGELSKTLMGLKAWTVDVFVDAEDATRERQGKLRSEGDYDWWLKLYTEFGRNPRPMAEICQWANNAVLRFRDNAGKSTEVVLGGENFLHLGLRNVDFEILKMYFHPLPPQVESKLGDQTMVSIYVRTSSFPSTDLAREFSRLMQSRLQQKRIAVAFRTDAYFLTDGTFPIVYWFDPPATLPSRKLYLESHTMYCFSDVPGIQCH